MVNCANASLPLQTDADIQKKVDWNNASLADIVQKEIDKFMKDKQVEANQVNFAHFNDFADSILHYAYSTLSLIDKDSWIVDTGASSHICSNIN